MKLKDIHVGKLILNYMKKNTTLRQKDLCPVLKCQESAVGKKLRKKHFGEIAEIFKVCEFLEHDFFRDISDSFYPEKQPEYKLIEKINNLEKDLNVYREHLDNLKEKIKDH